MTFNELVPNDLFRESLIKRFWSMVKKSDGCWSWSGSKHPKGYGRLQAVTNSGKRVINAHRISYFIHFGEIAEGMCVCHSCDNGECSNPKHLFLGSHEKNMGDAALKQRLPHGEGHFAVKISDKDVLSIRELHANGDISISNLAKIYNTPYRTMVSIVRGHSRTVTTPI